jgi:hypothetical protein
VGGALILAAGLLVITAPAPAPLNPP